MILSSSSTLRVPFVGLGQRSDSLLGSFSGVAD